MEGAGRVRLREQGTPRTATIDNADKGDWLCNGPSPRRIGHDTAVWQGEEQSDE
jgi:hypothetical protein